MIALGNDVIDLCWSPKHGASYFNRLKSYAFSAPELQMVSDYSLNYGTRLLWSIKESCYKSVIKNGFVGRFVPKDINIESIEFSKDLVKCTICHDSVKYHSHSFVNSKQIHTVSLPIHENFNSVVTGTAIIESNNYSSQTKEVRKLANECLSMYHSGTIAFCKNENGIPFVKIDGLRSEVEINFSHDENIVAFALVP